MEETDRKLCREEIGTVVAQLVLNWWRERERERTRHYTHEEPVARMRYSLRCKSFDRRKRGCLSTILDVEKV